ncbi:MAG: type II CRISPR RNA-guided endonuclease Cas9 [Flavobacteriales bacterium]|nr:type II CRISPR RNA-guided endonuclease Cas9 [Flavobacteriales bacterium]
MESKNELIVGLDVGSNSVGWAVVEMNGEKLEKIHGMGSRIIPMGDEKKEYEQGAKITKNNARRQKRSMRRNHQRYKLRRANLVRVLKLMDAWPDGLGEQAKPDEPVLTPLQVYGLRALSVDDPVSLKELGRVLYHMNQRRGYKDIGDLMDEQDGAAPSEAKDDGKRIEKVFIEAVEVDDDKGKKVKYLVRLGDGREGTCTLDIIKGMIGTEQELEITTRKNKDGGRFEFRLAQKTDWRKGMESINAAIDESGLTPGQFFHGKIKHGIHNGEFYRIKEQIVLRDTFKKEFDIIWVRQTKEHPALNSDELRDRVVKALVPNNLAEQAKWLKKSLGAFTRDYVIYYQRPLKSQAKDKGHCRFEVGSAAKDGRSAIPPKQVMPVSSPMYQLFRIWQQVNNIRLIDRYSKESELSASERILVVECLLEQHELKRESLLKEIGRKGEDMGDNLRANLPGHQTLDKLRPMLKKTGVWKRLQQEAAQLKDPQSTLLFRIWHILYSVPMEKDRVEALAKLKDLPSDAISGLAKVRYERKHGAVSARAASRILALMVCGNAWSVANIPERDQRRIQMLIDGEEVHGIEPEMREHLRSLGSIEHFQGLAYWKAATALYGDHRAATAKPFDKPEEIKTLSRGFLRNPVVEQVVNETLMIMRDIWSTYGRPTSVRVELARELRQNQKERERTFDNNKKRDKVRKSVVDILVEEFNRPKPSRKDIERYDLWIQQGMRCMYSGKPIQKEALFDSRDTDVDHIIPKALFYDDSIQNKVLCRRDENAGANGKNRQLAAPYMKSKGVGEWEAYVDRVNDLKAGWGKKKYLLAVEVPDSFISRQLQETRYIGTKVAELLQPIVPKVNTTLGIVTDALKNEWGLDKVFKEMLIPRFERLESITGRKLIQEIPITNGNKHKDWKIEGFAKRIDHRHHALDALVVALTRQGYIQRLSNVNQIVATKEEKEAMKRPTWYPLPHPDLRTLVKYQLDRTIPSIKNRQRLLTKTTNLTRYLKDPESGRTDLRKQKNGDLRAVRGPLHNEQPMGEVREQRKWLLKDVLASLSDKRDPLDELKQVERGDPDYGTRFLAHDHERSLLHAHLTKYAGNVEAMKKALKKDPLVNAKNERVEHLTVLAANYSITRKFSALFTEKMAGKIIDVQLRKRVQAHMKAYGNDSKKAFTAEAMHAFNKDQRTSVMSVRCRMDDTLVGEAMGRARLSHKGDPNGKQYVEKGENYALAVFVHEETGAREFEVVAFFDAVRRKLKGLDLVDERPGYKHFLLRKNDVVYVPRPDEEVRSIDWKDTEAVGDRVMRLTQMTGNRNYFLRTQISSVLSFGKEEMEFGSQNAAEFEDRDEPRTKIGSVCIPISVDRIGQVRPVVF